MGFQEEIQRWMKVDPDLRLEWYGSFSSRLPPRKIYDYDALILNLAFDLSNYFREKYDEMSELLKGGGLIISFCSTLDAGWFNVLLKYAKVSETASAAEWEELVAEMEKGFIKMGKISFPTSPLEAIKAGAKTIDITPQAGALSSVLKKLDWYEYYFSSYPQNATILAQDKVKHPIALRLPCWGGEVILLPGRPLSYQYPTEYQRTSYWQDILSSLVGILPQLKRLPEKVLLPAWVSDYKFPEEKELIKQDREIHTKLEKIRLRKYLLATRGKPLEDAVGSALREMGFVVEKQPEGSYVDFILKIDGVEKAGIEVAGSIAQINVKEFRQLLHFLQDCEVDKKEMKGILVGNHFCEKAPSERGDAFTKDAIEAAEKHKVTLLTTIDLFDALLRLDKGETLPKDVQTKILKSVGICKLV